MDMARVQCPRCRSGHVARILYGRPPSTEKLQQALDGDRIMLGGRHLMHDDPERHCYECHYEWTSDTQNKLC